MATAKDIRVAPISADDANRLVRVLHYSSKVVPNSQLHLGVFLDGRLEGAMQFGPSMDKRKTLGLVRDTPWNGFLELNRMAFSDRLPRNSESRAIAIAMRMLRKTYPHLEWVISFADGTQCGDGTIYRASGFMLSGIKPNKTILLMPDGSVVADKTLNNSNYILRGESAGYWKKHGAAPLDGFQLRYIYFLNPSARDRLTVPVLPFSRIDEMGAGMYKGKARVKQATEGDQPEGGGAAPTHALQSPTIEDDATEARRA
jgi:hypothetical protein